jgi:hypothetical protein
MSTVTAAQDYTTKGMTACSNVKLLTVMPTTDTWSTSLRESTRKTPVTTGRWKRCARSVPDRGMNRGDWFP